MPRNGLTSTTRPWAAQVLQAVVGLALVAAGPLSGASLSGGLGVAVVGVLVGAVATYLPERFRLPGTVVLLIGGVLVVSVWDRNLALCWLGGLLVGLILGNSLRRVRT